MSFLHPTLALVGLAAISLPIIIHLLIRRRVKPVRWAAMKFLMQAYKQRRRRLILEQLLLLAARCLLVALIALAIGRLVLGKGVAPSIASRPTSLVLLLDDSLTSGADGGLERSKSRALELLAQLDPGAGDTISLITLSTPATPVVLPPSSDVGAVRGLIERLAPTDAAADFGGAIELLARSGPLEDAGGAGPRVVVAALSDFLAGSIDAQSTLGSISPRPDAVLVSEPRSDAVDNFAVIGLEPLRSVVTGGRSLASSNQARVTLRRFGPSVARAAKRQVRLLTSDGDQGTTLLDEGQARFEPGQVDATIILSAQAGPAEATGRIARPLICEIEPDALASDNVLRQVVEFRDAIRVAVVAPRRFDSSGGIDRFDSADWVSRALEPLGQTSSPLAPSADIQVARVEPGAITGARLAGFDAMVLCAPQLLDQTGWDATGSFAREGGLVVVVPPAEAQTHVWTDQLRSTLALPWDVSRDTATLEPPSSIQARAAEGGPELLTLVRTEMPELARAVTVRKVLPLRTSSLATGQVVPTDRDAMVPLTLSDGSPFLIAARPDSSARTGEDSAAPARGLVVLFASSLDLSWTDLPAKPLVVPVMQEIIRQGVGLSRGTWSATAGLPVPIPVGTVEVRLLRTDDRTGTPIAFAVTPPPSGTSGEASGPPLRHGGLYRANDAGGATRGTIAVAPDHRASDTSAVDRQAVLAWLAPVADGAPVTAVGASIAESLSNSLREGSRRTDLATPLLAAALALALLELVIARWSSHARRTTDSGITAASPAIGASDSGVAA